MTVLRYVLNNTIGLLVVTVTAILNNLSLANVNSPQLSDLKRRLHLNNKEVSLSVHGVRRRKLVCWLTAQLHVLYASSQSMTTMTWKCHLPLHLHHWILDNGYWSNKVFFE